MKTRSRLITTLMLALLSAAAHGTPFWMDDTAGKPGDTVELTLNDGNAQNLEAVDLLITYDVSQLEFLDALVGALTSDFQPIPYDSPPGEVRVSLALFFG